MKHLKLKANEIVALELIRQNIHYSWYIRSRAECLLMSNKGFSMSYLADHFGTHKRTIENWLNHWETQGISSLQKQTGKSVSQIKEMEYELEEQVYLHAYGELLVFED